MDNGNEWFHMIEAGTPGAAAHESSSSYPTLDLIQQFNETFIDEYVSFAKILT